MPRPGIARSLPKFSADVMAAVLMLAGSAAAEPLNAYRVVGDAIPAPLTGTPGDPVRGRAIVADRQTGLCLLCHSAPIPQVRLQGNIGPDLAGVGSRLNPGQIRLRLVEPSRTVPQTVMPSFYRVEGLDRVGAAWRGKPMLSAQQIEDVVAYLASLK